ncbi:MULTISPECIES: hypothetical protein [Pseudomonas]|jgi:hypothetical protein|uniref:Uncharacterized protein n=2 Tax=Pseudomonas TaxID=286 RepID=A0A9X8EJI9_PSEPU|nr:MULTISPECIES: hypothetical protein [Pseudomonas]KIU51542.1 hypothetical protein QV12_11650 [Pseudomonas putida]KTC25265.1 hypothetical protein AO392_13610 [Pseudomonas putida]MBG8561112.1 hypothetical protein [Pseudomonas qingdaonensis]MCO7505967.1 hypothetical protein [Pseudomonas sp. VE 267-6A]MCO7528301.1 hypothetical protein [Pseudomonas sp. 2]
MKGIHDDLEHTAADLEQIAREMAGHARYLQHSAHPQDALEVQRSINGLQASIDQLRSVADRIEP